MKTNGYGIACLVAVSLLLATPAVRADLAELSKDFESLVSDDPDALKNDGWKIFANVYDSGGSYLYGYGTFDAPNQSEAFSNVAVGEGGPAQGQQQLVVFSDYNNTDHGVGNLIEANVFQEQTVGTVDVGKTFVFRFDAKRGDIAGATTAIAFIRTLDPNAGFATTNFITVDTTNLPITWGTYEIELAIDAVLVGQIFQIGFLSTATNYEASGVFYDNVSLSVKVSSANGDLDGDGKSDILWRNTSSGQNWAYLMNGASVATSAGINTVADQAWQVVGNGDYDGDGDADILWRNSSTGQNWMYLMNGATIVASIGVNTVADLNWEIVGNGDYDGDGRADILWRNKVTGQNWMYLMDGATRLASLGVNTVSDLDWKVQGSGDYNGDGKADILWRNISSGINWLYLMNGAAITTSAQINTVSNQDWKITGNGDANGDGKADILWRNVSTGLNWLYLMDGSIISASTQINTVSDLAWEIVGNGDYNGDGKADILWRNSVTGQNWMYLMNGATRQSSQAVNTVSDLNWKVVNTN